MAAEHPAPPEPFGPYRSVGVAVPGGAPSPCRWLLLSTYDLGRQPSALAAAAGELRRGGDEVELVDLSVDELDLTSPAMHRFDAVLWSLPMHTATRLAMARMAEVATVHPALRQAAFGLYAELNESTLASLGVALWRGARPAPSFDRRGLPGLDRYARLVMADGTTRLVGATEASVGCRHRCRHCPVVAVFAGRFRPVPLAEVLRDIEALVQAGAQHISFGDPDFLNGPAHGLRVATALHRRFGQLSFDITTKVEHLRRYAPLLGPLRDAGCTLITSAVESFDDVVLERLDKGHTAADVAEAVSACRAQGIGLNPTFVPFTPWTTVAGYRRMLDEVEALGLIDAVHPVQYGLRLLLSARSALLELDDVAALAEPFDPVALAHPWRHPDPAVDALQQAVMALVRAGADDAQGPLGRRALHRALRELAGPDASVRVGSAKGGRVEGGSTPQGAPQPATIAWFTEPWFC